MFAFQSCKKPVYDELTFKIIERFSYDLERKTREQNRKNKRTEIRAIWLVYRTETNARGFWLVQRKLGWNQPILRFDVTLQLNRPIERCLLHIRVFSGGKTKRPCKLWYFHPLAVKTNNEHLPKPSSKVIRKSLYPIYWILLLYHYPR